jgi:hypothetical protein
MSITPNIPDSSESHSYQASSTPRWVPIALVALFLALGAGIFWLRSQGQASQAALQSELSAAKIRSDQLANALEETNQRLAQMSAIQVTSRLGRRRMNWRARARWPSIQKDQQETQIGQPNWGRRSAKCGRKAKPSSTGYNRHHRSQERHRGYAPGPGRDQGPAGKHGRGFGCAERIDRAHS